jgi:hypothetical protein
LIFLPERVARPEQASTILVHMTDDHVAGPVYRRRVHMVIMTRVRWTLFVGTFLLMAPGTLLLAGNKVYVATFGNDGNPCNTFSQPCATFNGAISKAGPAGVVLALDAGDFGSINISNPITIDGGAHGAFASGNPTAVSVGLGMFADGPVILRNISIIISPSGGSANEFGIFGGISGGSLILDRVSVTAVPTTTQTATGIQINIAAAAPVNLQNITIAGAQTGILLANAAGSPTAPFQATLENVSVDASQFGLNVVNGGVNVRNSSFRGASDGVALSSSSTSATSLVESTQIANNNVGIAVFGGTTVRLSGNVISGNVTGISNAGGTVISFRNNVFAGNGTDGSPPLATSLK